MDWKSVFPEYAVKQAFHEANLERNDELIISAMQASLVTRCLYSILKPAMLNCVHNKRKLINADDLDLARALTMFPMRCKPADAGLLLDSIEFKHMVQEHLRFLTSYLTRSCAGANFEGDYKLSQEMIFKLQDLTEECIRGFVHLLEAHGTGQVSFRMFETTMADVLGDPSYINFDQGYVAAS